ncbi:hypothetical protein HUT18_11500 [Streptomyces sp. NA04227]|uniref:hypothetical protein n=1 Tax=Streptomyces sp. NA04227 TaxID=2742136 RepID=UPI001590C21D|nr:hypothetical protein [Streptomyces sp. NA04227]QKW06924.1 hypothetical protein HUT18_11500 [Streptomyces sp. NA04227]
MGKAQQAWGGLNARQRIYMEVMYGEDQGLEEEQRQLGTQGRFTKAPAQVWRRIFLSGRDAPTPRALRARGLWESGAGSTLAALADRGLIELGTTDTGAPYALLTRAGRAATRAGLGIAPMPSKAPWELSEWLWREMAKVARAGEDGLPPEELFGSAHLYLVTGYDRHRGNRPYLDVHEESVTYTPRDFSGNLRAGHQASRTVRRYRFTEAGRAHYVDHVEDYRKFYPEIEAPDLAVVPRS